jgi:hypothetical protein
MTKYLEYTVVMVIPPRYVSSILILQLMFNNKIYNYVKNIDKVRAHREALKTAWFTSITLNTEVNNNSRLYTPLVGSYGESSIKSGQMATVL